MSDLFDSDDPFADFTADDLDILEQQAHAATQRPPHSQQRHRQPPRPQPTKYHAQQPIRPLPSRTASLRQPLPLLEDPATEDDYDQFTVDEDDLFIGDNPPQPTPTPTPPHPQPQPPQPSPAYLSRFPTDIDQVALMQELASLRAETSRLKAERDKLEVQSFTQDGKLDHLQRTLHRAREDHESALTRLKRVTEGEKRALQSDLADRERRLAVLTADIEFQRNELREARELAMRGTVIRPPTSSSGVNGDSFAVSPRRPRVVKGSGVKSPESKSKVGTQAFGREERVGVGGCKKRKREERMVTPEPVVRESAVVVETMNEAEIGKLILEGVLKERSLWAGSDDRFRFMRDVLGFRMEDGMVCFSALAEMSYSTEQYAISSILIHEITTLAASAEDETALANILCEILCAHWNRCLYEELYHPLFPIQSLLNFILLQSYPTCAHTLSLSASPIHLAQTTINLHASKRIYNKSLEQLPYPSILSSFTILSTIASALDPLQQTKFWEILSVNFVIMCLHTKQLPGTIAGMAELLAGSVCEEGFGAKGGCEEEGVNDPVMLVLDKLTVNLIEEPRMGASREELWALRQTIVDTMGEIVAGNERGSKILHSAGFVVPRIIALLANEIEYFYSRPEDALQSIALSKSCVRLLHAVIMQHSPDTLSHFLSPFPGAQQAHNVAMTRLSFGGESETVFVDVADLARDLLEAAVSPEEGDMIYNLFQWDEGGHMDIDDDESIELGEFMD